MLSFGKNYSTTSARWLVDSIGVGAVLLVLFLLGGILAVLRIESTRLEREQAATLDVSRNRRMILDKRDEIQQNLAATKNERPALSLHDENITEDAGFLKKLSDFAALFDLTLEELRPAATRPTGVDMHVTAAGSFDGVCRLLQALEGLPTSVEIANCDVRAEDARVGICRLSLLVRLDRTLPTQTQLASQGVNP
jgi:hypothetical protein